MTKTIQKIGIFDSGVGGLTVFEAIRKALPAVEIVYLGDTARVPYGIRSPEIIRKYSDEDTKFLLEHSVDLIVVACNTASAHALEFLKAKLSVPVFGVIEPGAKVAADTTKNKRIGIIGTEGTIGSQVYETAIRKIDPTIRCFSKATPLFVSLVEEGITEHRILSPIFDYYLHELKQQKIDTLVLGCTHYPLLKQPLSDYFGREVKLIDSANAIAQFLQRDFFENRQGGHAPFRGSAPTTIFVTDAPERITRVVKTLFDMQSVEIKKVFL